MESPLLDKSLEFASQVAPVIGNYLAAGKIPPLRAKTNLVERQ